MQQFVLIRKKVLLLPLPSLNPGNSFSHLFEKGAAAGNMEENNRR
ncbi:hypothetical protein AC06_0276 [Escherichia coli 3-373-03_S3_C1]|nr:hypothetical protein AC06_0276 [Escherichia coli 3-373-03_S3_C1]